MPSRGSGRPPACSRPLPGCPGPQRGSAAHVRPFLFTLGDELLLSLSAVLALLFVFKSSYNFAPRFIANSIYLLLSRVSAHILQSVPPPLWTNHQGHGAGTRRTGMGGWNDGQTWRRQRQEGPEAVALWCRGQSGSGEAGAAIDHPGRTRPEEGQPLYLLPPSCKDFHREKESG